MIKFHQYMFMSGAIITAIGTFIGLPVLMLGYQDAGKFMIMFAPLGMLLMLTGLTVITLHSPKSKPKVIHSQQDKIPD